MFKSGTSGNPSGRPKGTKNKVVSELKEFLREGLLSRKEKLLQMLDATENESEYVDNYTKIAKIVFPREPAVQIETEKEELIVIVQGEE